MTTFQTTVQSTFQLLRLRWARLTKQPRAK